MESTELTYALTPPISIPEVDVRFREARYRMCVMTSVIGPMVTESVSGITSRPVEPKEETS